MLRATQSQRQFLEDRFSALMAFDPISYANLVPSALPGTPGVYLISAKAGSDEIPYYVGRTKNLRERLYRHHLMGKPTSARLKKYLITSGECISIEHAKVFIRSCCWVRWLTQEGFRERAALEGYITAILFPK